MQTEGHHDSLEAHLSPDGPKRILSLDGGGVLGVIEIAFLEEIEALLRRRTENPDLVLSDYFDLIGGTSTGAIIATALALGFTAAQVKALYFGMAPAIFSRPLMSIPGIGPRFNAGVLASKLRAMLGERQLQSEDLRTGLAIISKRVDTGSPWVLTNNPGGKYWSEPDLDPETKKRPYIGNRRYKLRDLLRASSAAPFFFNPKRMTISEHEPDGLFVDGGVSPHNNPALQLLMLATIKAYGFCWRTGADQLMLMSIGSGWLRPRISLHEGTRMWSAMLAGSALRSVTWDAQVQTLKILLWLSEPRRPWIINSEVGALEEETLGDLSRGLIHFERYDIKFESKWLKEELGVEMTETAARALNDFTNPEVMAPAYELAQKAAKKHVVDADFPAAFDIRMP